MFYNWQNDKKTQEICRSIGSFPYITNYDAQSDVLQAQREYKVNSVLDLGCGRGNILEHSLVAGLKTADGVEYFQSYISAARRRLRKYQKSRYTIYQGDIRSWKPKKKYDLLYAFEPLSSDDSRTSLFENMIEYLSENQLVLYITIEGFLNHKLFTHHFEHVSEDNKFSLFKFHRNPLPDRNTFWKCKNIK